MVTSGDQSIGIVLVRAVPARGLCMIEKEQSIPRRKPIIRLEFDRSASNRISGIENEAS